jgi:DNA-binding response OmpR family regulator
MPTALIVEDEPEANKLLAMLLQLRGYRTESAYRGDEALQKIRDQVPDVVFLDLMLPDMNGYDVCRSLRSSGPNSLIPVVIVTARLTAENRIESFDVGADDYIPKPYTPDQIFEALDRSRTCKDQIAAPEFEGEVPLDVRDDGETLRRLAQLRRLMQARSDLGPHEIERISTVIKMLWSSGDNWSRHRRLNQVATLSYSLTPDSLTLTVHDEAGWLPSSCDLNPDHASSPLSQAQFDQVIADEADHSLKLVKRFATR